MAARIAKLEAAASDAIPPIPVPVVFWWPGDPKPFRPGGGAVIVRVVDARKLA